jgi:hypothetical protein
MNISTDKLSVAHIHAYVDAQLNDRDCALVEEYFDEHPERLEELQQYLAINEHCQAMFGPLLNDTVTAQFPAKILTGELDSRRPKGLAIFLQRFENVVFDKQFNLAWFLYGVSNGIRFIGKRLLSRLSFRNFGKKQPPLLAITSGAESGNGHKHTNITDDRKIFKKLRFPPGTATDWWSRLIRWLSDFKTKAMNSYAEVNIFAGGSIIIIGILIGAYW